MAKPYLPVQPAPRVIHYAGPANPASGVLPLSERELAVKRRQDQILYARWRARRADLAERDRRVRRFWLAFGAVTGLGVLATLAALVWWLTHAAGSLGLGVLVIPVVLLAAGGLAVGGHKCVTVIQHWH